MQLFEEERYLAQLHGNLSTASPLNWNHFMDYHGGILFESCGPLLGRLRADGVPFCLQGMVLRKAWL